MQKIVVTGSNGQLGQELQALSNLFLQKQFYFFNRTDLDISDKEAVNKIISDLKPDYCINCAAYTAVDKAETEPETAFKINASGAENLAAACAQHNTKFIHVSTDYVFNGAATFPYKEDDATHPIGVYGASKLRGEELVMAANPEAIIIRTSWVYSVYGNNFVKTMVRLMNSKEEINVVNDQWGTPTYAADLAAALLHITAQKWSPGVYHFSNEGVINWFQFASAIKDCIHTFCKVHPITTAEYPTLTARPHYSVLAKEKIQTTFNLELVPWQESLCKCLDKLAKI